VVTSQTLARGSPRLRPARIRDHILAVLESPNRLKVAGILRILLGTIALLFFLAHFRERQLIWGPDGQIDWSYFANFAGPLKVIEFYAWSSTVGWSQVVYAISIVACLGFTLGVCPRVSAILLALLVRSAFDRNWEVLDGGHNILGLTLVYLSFADLRYAALWVPKPLKWLTQPLPSQIQTQILAFGDSIRRISHNLAMSVILIQIALLYFWSVFYKIGGHKWQDGTAVYYVMRANEFSLPGISQIIYTNATLVTLLTLSTLVFQMSMPFLMWNRKCKPYLFLAAASFHTGIAVFMGLVYFSMSMIAVDFAIFDDRAIESIEIRAKSLWESATRRSAPIGKSAQQDA